MRHVATVLLVGLTLPTISCGDLSDEAGPAVADEVSANGTDFEERTSALRRLPRGGGAGTTGTAESTGTAGSGAVGTGGTGVGTSPGFQAIVPCTSESAFVTGAVVTLRGGGQGFFPACVRLASGGTVVFQGSFQDHPLLNRALGTTPSPILGTSFGGAVEYEFSNPGVYTYGCAAHPTEIGVVWASTQ